MRVLDGDTLTIDGVTWRLWGVDAPELMQTCDQGLTSCGIHAQGHLIELVAGRFINCEQRGKSYDRIVGKCWAEGVDLAAALVKAGHALDYPRHSHGEYADEEADARAAVRGIWAGDFVTPERWRRGHR